MARAFAAPSRLTHPPGTTIANRFRTGTSSPNQTPASRVTNTSPGNRRRLRGMAPPPTLSRLPAGPRTLVAKLADARSCTLARSASPLGCTLTDSPALARLTSQAARTRGSLGFPLVLSGLIAHAWGPCDRSTRGSVPDLGCPTLASGARIGRSRVGPTCQGVFKA